MKFIICSTNTIAKLDEWRIYAKKFHKLHISHFLGSWISHLNHIFGLALAKWNFWMSWKVNESISHKSYFNFIQISNILTIHVICYVFISSFNRSKHLVTWWAFFLLDFPWIVKLDPYKKLFSTAITYRLHNSIYYYTIY